MKAILGSTNIHSGRGSDTLWDAYSEFFLCHFFLSIFMLFFLIRGKIILDKDSPLMLVPNFVIMVREFLTQSWWQNNSWLRQNNWLNNLSLLLIWSYCLHTKNVFKIWLIWFLSGVLFLCTNHSPCFSTCCCPGRRWKKKIGKKEGWVCITGIHTSPPQPPTTGP